MTAPTGMRQAQAEPRVRAFALPPTDWPEDNPVQNPTEALRGIVNTTLQAGAEPVIRDLERRIERLNQQVQEYKRMIREYQEAMQTRKQARKEAERELEERRGRQGTAQLITDDELQDFVAWLKAVKGVIGVRIKDDQSIVILLRTAIRNNAGELFDMGDFELTLRAAGYGDVDTDAWYVSQALQIKCVRGAKRRYGEYELIHPHYERAHPRQRDQGWYYAQGGYFCTGQRAGQIARYLNDGDLKQALNLLIASMNDTQYKDELRNYGRFIPDEFEEAFFAPLS